MSNMNFKEYLKQAWETQASDPRAVADDFRKNFSLIESADDIMALSELIVHVCGEQLGDWLMGLELLKRLKNNSLHKKQY